MARAQTPLPIDARTRTRVALPKLTKLELQVMDALWTHGPLPIRDIQESFPAANRPAYTTVQTLVYRLEAKGALRRTRKIGNAQIVEATVSRRAAERRLVDDLLALFGGRIQPLMSHLIESGRLTLDDVDEARAELRRETKGEPAAPAGRTRKGASKSPGEKR
jgi:predicted transcriptional regulator